MRVVSPSHPSGAAVTRRDVHARTVTCRSPDELGATVNHVGGGYVFHANKTLVPGRLPWSAMVHAGTLGEQSTSAFSTRPGRARYAIENADTATSDYFNNDRYFLSLLLLLIITALIKTSTHLRSRVYSLGMISANI